MGCLHVLCLGCLRPASKRLGGGAAVFGAVTKCVGPFRFTGLARLGLSVWQWGFPQKRGALLVRGGGEAVVGPRCRGVVFVPCGLSQLEAVSVVDHLPTPILILYAERGCVLCYKHNPHIAQPAQSALRHNPHKGRSTTRTPVRSFPLCQKNPKTSTFPGLVSGAGQRETIHSNRPRQSQRGAGSGLHGSKMIKSQQASREQI